MTSTAADEDAAEWVAAHRIEPSFVGERAQLRGQAVAVERISRHRADEVGAAPLQRGMQRRRIRHLTFEKFAFVFGGGRSRGRPKKRSARDSSGIRRDDAARRIRNRGRSRETESSPPSAMFRSPGRALASATPPPARTRHGSARGKTRRSARLPDGSRGRPADASSSLPAFLSASPCSTVAP